MRYRSRKFIAFMLITVLATGLCLLGLLSGALWASFVGGSYAVYCTGNVAQKATAVSLPG